MFGDPSCRADLGMMGGSALARCHVPSDHMSVAACDEDTAFTYIIVPRWMRAWQAGPPIAIRADEVWRLLPEALQHELRADRSAFVAPQYTRLAMGGSHSVYVLMRINLHHIG